MWEDTLTAVVEEDIEDFVSRPQSDPPEILLFPPLLGRYRYHIHQLVENRFPFLVTESVGTDDDRRLTVSFRESNHRRTCEPLTAVSNMATMQLENHNGCVSDNDHKKVDLPRKTRPAMQTYVPPPQRSRPDSAIFDRADQRSTSSLSNLSSGQDMGENLTRSRSTASNQMRDSNKDCPNRKDHYFGTALRMEEERPRKGCDGSGDHVRRPDLRDRGQNAHRSGGQRSDFRVPPQKGRSISSSNSGKSNGKASGDAVADPVDYFKARPRTLAEPKSSLSEDRKTHEDKLPSSSLETATNPGISSKTSPDNRERALPDLQPPRPEVPAVKEGSTAQNEPGTKPADRSAVPIQTKINALRAEPKRVKPRFAQSEAVSRSTLQSPVATLQECSVIENGEQSMDGDLSKSNVATGKSEPKSSILLPSEQVAHTSPQRFSDIVQQRDEDVPLHAGSNLPERTADKEEAQSSRPKSEASLVSARDNQLIQCNNTEPPMNSKTLIGDGKGVSLLSDAPKVEKAEAQTCRTRFGPDTVQPLVYSSLHNGVVGTGYGAVLEETHNPRSGSSCGVEESHPYSVQPEPTTECCNESALPEECEYQGFRLYRLPPEPLSSPDWKRETRDLSQPYTESDFKQEQHEKRNLADLRGRLEQNASMCSSGSGVKIMKRPLINSPNIRSYKYIPPKREFVRMPDKEFRKFTEALGEISVIESQGDYRVFSPASDVGGQEFRHVLEVSNIPPEFATADLDKQIHLITQEYYDLKWVDDTHALAIFSNAASADNALRMRNTGAKIELKALVNAGELTRRKARLFLKLDDANDPGRDRPDVNVGIARRMLGGALGMKIPVGKGVREQEVQQLREARDRKQKSIQQKEDVWEGNV